jgi:hypothetical protein
MQRTTVPEDKDQKAKNNPLVASITPVQPNSTACSAGSRKESGALDQYNLELEESEKKTIDDVPGLILKLVRRPIVESYMPGT